MRFIVIDPATQSLREECLGNSLQDLQRAVGGRIAFAHQFPNGDVLYVDEDGLERADLATLGEMEAARAFFFDIGAHQEFAGKGIIVGTEGEDGRHGPAASSLADIASRLAFLAPLAYSASGPAN